MLAFCILDLGQLQSSTLVFFFCILYCFLGLNNIHYPHIFYRLLATQGLWLTPSMLGYNFLMEVLA